MILRLTIVLCQAFEIRKSTHRDAKLGSNRAVTRSARTRSFWTSPVEETKTRIVFARRLPASMASPPRHHFQSLGRALEPSRWVLLKEHLKKNG